MKRIAILPTGILFLMLGAAMAAEPGWTPKPEQLARLEQGLVLPAGSHSLNDYARYYWGTTSNGAKIIRGVFVFGEKIGITVVNAPPYQRVADQGCNRIFVTYDLSHHQAAVQCDGIG